MRHGRLSLVALAACAAACGPRFNPPATAGSQAPQLGGIFSIRYRQPLREHDVFSENAQELAGPVADGALVFVGSSGGSFYALDAASGHAVWTFPVGAGISSTPLLDRKIVYFGADDGNAYALDRVTGRKLWSYATHAPIHQAPVVAGGALYLVNADGHVVALDAASGQFKWQYQRESPDSFTIRGEARPLPAGDRVYAGFHDGNLVALSAASGEVIWARPLGADKKQFVDVNTSPQIVDGVLYAGCYAVGLYALDPAEGGVRWRYDVEGASTPTIDTAEQRIYFAAPDRGLHVIDMGGHLVYAQATPGAGDPARPVFWGPYVLLATSNAGLYLARRSDGMLLQYFNPGSGFTTPPTVDGGHLFALSNQGYLYALDLD